MNTSSHLKVDIRPMEKKDLPAILAIELDSFPEPYCEKLFLEELEIQCAHLWVAEFEDRVAGYIDYWLIHDEFELISIAVAPPFRRMGIGRLLMEKMIEEAVGRKVHIIYLDVRQSNLGAQQLYKNLNFKQAGIRKRYYKNNKENALILVKEL